MVGLSPQPRRSVEHQPSAPTFLLVAAVTFLEMFEANRRGNPAQWLATDTPVPVSMFRALEVWYDNTWVNVESLDTEAYEQWLEPLSEPA